MYVYSLISHRVQQTSQFTPLVLELSLVQSHLLWGEFSAFSAAIAIHNSPLFVPPGTLHCWVDRGGMIWKACPTPLHMAGNVTRASVTHPSTNRARCCLTSVIWRELVTTRPCATRLQEVQENITGTNVTWNVWEQLIARGVVLWLKHLGYIWTASLKLWRLHVLHTFLSSDKGYCFSSFKQFATFLGVLRACLRSSIFIAFSSLNKHASFLSV